MNKDVIIHCTEYTQNTIKSPVRDCCCPDGRTVAKYGAEAKHLLHV